MNFLFEKNNLTRKKIIESVIIYNKLSEGENIENLSEEEQNKILQKIDIFFICSKEIEKIDNLTPYINLKELYLRNNYINEIRGLNTLINLKVLNLQYNMIHKIKNISHLINLEVLDISENDIYDFDSNQLPENLIYLYFYYNPFFELYDKDKIFIYRSQIIQKCIKIERIDKLDVRDRERLLLFDEKKIKNKKKFSLNSLSYVFQHYEQFEIDNNKKIENLNKKMNNIIINDIKNDENEISTCKYDRKETLKQIQELENKTTNFFNSSIFKIQKEDSIYSKKNTDNHKKFIESKEMKELNKYLQILTEKFEKAKFNDLKIKEEMEERVKKAINFSQRITNAETIAKDIIERINNQKLNIPECITRKEDEINKKVKKQKNIKSIFEEEKASDESIYKNKLSQNNSLLSLSEFDDSFSEEKKSN